MIDGMNEPQPNNDVRESVDVRPEWVEPEVAEIGTLAELTLAATGPSGDLVVAGSST